MFQNEEIRFIKDRRLRTDGFIIRAQATIRTGGFSVRAGLANTCALRAPTPLVVRIHTIRTTSGVLQGNRISHALAVPQVNFEMRS